MNNLLKPYDEHYMNCYLNNLFSISYTRNPESKLLSYLNDYNITLEKHGDFRHLQFDYSERFYTSIYERAIGIKCKSKFDIYKEPLGTEFMISSENINELSNALKQGNIVFLLVDLFYLNNGNVFFSKIHRQHFLMLIEWNAETESFIIVDDGNKGYGYYSVGLSDMKHFIRNSGQAYCLSMAEHESVDLVDLNMQDVIINSNRICEQIQKIGMSFEKLSFPKNYSEFCQILIFVQRCYNRQVCNELLLKYHMDNATDTAKSFKCIIKNNGYIKSLWYNIRAILLRHMTTGKFIDYEAVFLKILECLNREVVFWEMFNKTII